MNNSKHINIPFHGNLSEKEYFILACFSPDLQWFYSSWIQQKAGRKQFFTKNADGELVHRYWNPSIVCCESGEQLNDKCIDVKIGYWQPYSWKPIRKDLKTGAMAAEALACQNIDMSCNDCKHLDRGSSFCTLWDKKVRIYPNLCQPENLICFEHRRGYMGYCLLIGLLSQFFCAINFY